MTPRPWVPGPDRIDYLDYDEVPDLPDVELPDNDGPARPDWLELEIDAEFELTEDEAVIFGNFPIPTDDPDPPPDSPTTPLAAS